MTLYQKRFRFFVDGMVEFRNYYKLPIWLICYEGANLSKLPVSMRKDMYKAKQQYKRNNKLWRAKRLPMERDREEG